jgi:hypothetical protein
MRLRNGGKARLCWAFSRVSRRIHIFTYMLRQCTCIAFVWKINKNRNIYNLYPKLLARKDFSLYKSNKTRNFSKFSWSHLWSDCHETLTNKSRIKWSFYLYVYSVPVVVGNAIQFWVKINLPETKQSCQER